MDKETIGLIGLCAGAVVVVASVLSSPPDVGRAQVFQRENKPAVMRMYRWGGKDGIYVADSENPRNYIPLDKYLRGIEGKADRNLEEAAIKKVVGWYK
jgi:hypothetical protein